MKEKKEKEEENEEALTAGFKILGNFKGIRGSHLSLLAFPEEFPCSLLSLGSQPGPAVCSGDLPQREASYSVVSTLLIHEADFSQ